MKRLLRVVATVIVFGLGVYLTSSSLPVASAESSGSMFEPDEWRIGINVENRLVELGNAHVGETKVAGQTVSVYTDYHLGYRLDLSSPDSRMLGQTHHSEIRSMKSYEVGKDEIDIDTWAFKTSDDGGWSGLNGASKGMEIARDEGIFPINRDIEINYGVRTGISTMADDYKVELNYTLTALPPKTAVVKSITPNKIQIDGDRVIKAEGFGLTSGENNMVTLGVDFNDNERIDDNEKCALVGSADGFRGEYLVPELPDKTNKGGKYRLLIHDELGDDRDYDSGHEITYYYQPTIEVKGSHTPIKIKSSIGVVDVVSADLSAAILTDDGEIYTVGDMPLYYDDALAFERTPKPTLVDLPDIHIVDHPTSLAGYGNSYLLTTVQGSVYGWGDNSGGQLGEMTDKTFVSKPRLHPFFFDGRQNVTKRIDSLAMGNGFVAAVARNGADSLLYSWGRNDRGQGGWNSREIVASPTPKSVVENTSYAYSDDEYYVQVDIGEDYLIGLTNHGRVFTWGWHGKENEGDLGDGRLGFTTTDYAVRVHEITNKDSKNYLRDVYKDASNPIVNVAAGRNFGLALTQGGDLYRWGDSVCKNVNNLACDITDEIDLTDGEVIIGAEADGDQAVAWTSYGNVYNVADTSFVKILTMANIEGVDLGETSYLWTGDGRLYQWNGLDTELTDITSELTNPAYVLKVEGRHLNIANIWFDGNGDKINNDAPVTKNCLSDSECYLYLSTIEINNSGSYYLYAETLFGGKDSALVKVSKPTARSVVPDLTKPTITPLVDKNMVEEDEKSGDDLANTEEVKPSDTDKANDGDKVEDASENEVPETDVEITNDVTNKATKPVDSGLGENNHPVDDAVDDDSPLLADDGSTVELINNGAESVLDSTSSVDIDNDT